MDCFFIILLNLGARFTCVFSELFFEVVYFNFFDMLAENDLKLQILFLTRRKYYVPIYYKGTTNYFDQLRHSSFIPPKRTTVSQIIEMSKSISTVSHL